MFKRPHYIAAAVVIVTALLVMNLPGHVSARLKLGLGSLFLPLFGLAGASQQTANNASDAMLPRVELLRQNETLRRENQLLRAQAIQTLDTASENSRLRELVGWQQRAPWKLKLARVVLREPANWWRSVQIDLGSRDGLRENQPVLTADGLVGRVSSVSFTRSQVVLLGDPNCKVAALVQNDAGDKGIVGAGGPFDGSFVQLTYLSRNVNLKPGQNVVTSGLGGIFPKGIPVGKIVDSRPVEFGLYTEAQVKLAANLGALEEVWVMFQ